jgi:Rrf2 family protein
MFITLVHKVGTMKLTTKSRYGVRAIIHIARNYNQLPTKRKDIVDSEGIPDSYLENILIALKNRDLLHTIRGPRGGFVLKRHPSEITLLNVIEALQGSLAPVECIEVSSICERVDYCVTRPVWQRLQIAQEDVLRAVTVQDLVENSEKQQEVNYSI